MNTSSHSKTNSVEQGINAILSSAWLWGTATTVIFYAVLPFSPIAAHLLQRYFQANWIEYVLMGLFFVGACRLFRQLRQIPAERAVSDAGLFDGMSAEDSDDAVALAAQLESQLSSMAKPHQDTLLIKRVHDACRFVQNHRTSEGLEGHLKFLIEIGRARLNHDHALVRTIVWAIPVLGLLGTVISTATTIDKISNETLGSWAAVVIDLAGALDTTALALALATLLVFGKLIVEQFELKTFDAVNEFSVKRLPSFFPAKSVAEQSPFRLAEQQAAQQLLSQSERIIEAQMELWIKSLEELRDRWSSTLSKQQDSIDQMLKAGLTNSLASHTQEIVQSRSEFMTAFRQTSESIGSQLAETRAALAEQQQRGCDQIIETWQQFRGEITKTRDEHARQLALLTQAITAEVGGWQNQLQSSTHSISHHFQELQSQGEVFLKLSDNESQLIRLEDRLAQNLEAVRVVEVLENTLMSLNAAVNLLTSRVKLNAA